MMAKIKVRKKLFSLFTKTVISSSSNIIISVKTNSSEILISANSLIEEPMIGCEAIETD